MTDDRPTPVTGAGVQGAAGRGQALPLLALRGLAPGNVLAWVRVLG
jgi:hypothetical protein